MVNTTKPHLIELMGTAADEISPADQNMQNFSLLGVIPYSYLIFFIVLLSLKRY